MKKFVCVATMAVVLGALTALPAEASGRLFQRKKCCPGPVSSGIDGVPMILVGPDGGMPILRPDGPSAPAGKKDGDRPPPVGDLPGGVTREESLKKRVDDLEKDVMKIKDKLNLNNPSGSQ